MVGTGFGEAKERVPIVGTGFGKAEKWVPVMGTGFSEAKKHAFAGGTLCQSGVAEIREPPAMAP